VSERKIHEDVRNRRAGGVVTPRAAKFVGAASIVLWVLVIVSGRFVAYNWFRLLV
jgi:hypothetical protein